MPVVISRALILSPFRKSLPIPLNRYSFSSSASLSQGSNSQFYRSDLQSLPYVGSYEPGETTKGPLSRSSHQGTPKLTPTLLKQHLDKFVVGQDQAKKVTSVAIFNHYQRIREIRRQEDEERERREKKERGELRERARNAHPVESTTPRSNLVNSHDAHLFSSITAEYDGQIQTADLNRPIEPEPELGSKPLKDNNNSIVIEKSNLLLLGPSGVGKTYILQTLARVLEVPFATVDCSSLTQAGYIGTDIESSIERLLLAASHSVPKCETGIIFFDEVDKLAKPAIMTHGRDVSGEGVQQGLLKMIEGTTVTVSSKADRNSKTESQNSRGNDRLERGSGRESSASSQGKTEQYTIDSTNILFVFAGAFVGLEKIISKRLAAGTSIGFGAELRPASKEPSSKNDSSSNPLNQVTTSDLQSYGLIPELLGRIPITVSLTPLSLQQLVSILSEPKNSLVKQYIALFSTFSVELRFTTASLHAIAEKALPPKPKNDSGIGTGPGTGTGARGLRSILETILQEAMFVLPGTTTKFCLIDEQFVRSSGEGLPRCWGRASSHVFEEVWEREESEWDNRVNGRVGEDDSESSSFERLRVGGSSGM